MKTACRLGGLWLALLLPASRAAFAGEAGGPFPAPVPGFEAPKPGEHPRLFFRKADLPQIRSRAQTPGGQQIVRKLRQLLNGSDGQTLPQAFNDSAAKGGIMKASGVVMTLWHPAGYGMLYHLTGEKKYADLSKECVEKILNGARDADARYAYVNPNGALRAGPSLGALAMAYDLCYDGWDDGFRQKVAKAVSEGCTGSPLHQIESLVKGARLGVRSNHGGCQIGGGALAVLAVWKDAGVDSNRVEQLMTESQQAIVRQLTEGFGDGGYFAEGIGPGGMQLGVDFSRASGADALVVFTGSCPKGGKQVVAGSVTYQLVQMGGKAEEPKVSGDKVTLGGQTFHSDGKKILFAKIAKPQTLPRLGVWP
jgi:hypothetical protein